MAGATESTKAAIARDAGDLRRSLRFNLIGYVVKFAHPFLLIVVIALYGPGPFGVFSLVQAVLMVLLRLALLGLDKGLLWWIPRQVPADERLGLRAVLAISAATSAALALATALALAPLIAAWAGHPEITTSLRWMAAGLVPMAMLEVLCQAAVGKRHIEAHVIAKEGVVSLVMVLAALLLYALGLAETGLALAFFASYAAGLMAVLWVFRRAFAGSSWQGPAWRLPPALWRYSWPMWLSELAQALFVRLDVFVLAALTDEVAVGIFSGALQYASNVTAIRVSFDPMVMAMVSQIGHANDQGRLRRGFAHAWIMVATLQVPLVAFMVAGAAWIVPLLGESFAVAVRPALILIGLYSVHGLFGLNQHIVSGFGHSRLTFVNMLLAIASGIALLVLLIPGGGVDGAAWGIGLTYVLLNVLWAVEARVITGGWHYERSIAAVLGLTAMAAAAMAGAWFGLSALIGAGVAADLVARLGGLAAFAAVFAPGMLALRRSGRLAGDARIESAEP